MPASARDALLDAALTAIGERSWAAIRMVDIAAEAGVSRQTLYNEFGSKEGLARALARREADRFLAGVDHVLAEAGRYGGDAGDSFAAVTAWTLRTARRNPLVRATLTGCRGDRVPAAALTPVPVSVAAAAAPVGAGVPGPGSAMGSAAGSAAGVPGSGSGAAMAQVPGQRSPGARREDSPLTPTDLVSALRRHAALVLDDRGRPGADPAELGWACEAAVRLTVSYIVAPVRSDEEACRQVARLVRGLLVRSA